MNAFEEEMRQRRIRELRANCARNRITLKAVAEYCGYQPISIYNNMRIGLISLKRLDRMEEAYQELAAQKK
jgi:hypothetical protein